MNSLIIIRYITYITIVIICITTIFTIINVLLSIKLGPFSRMGRTY